MGLVAWVCGGLGVGRSGDLVLDSRFPGYFVFLWGWCNIVYGLRCLRICGFWLFPWLVDADIAWVGGWGFVGF